ncbi:MAG: hypothetical protein HKN56_02735, partial [Gammaproteobacteria bacterium]|nr:hypothetical protein [Gammaproteobacteria bacterium]
SIAWQCPYCNDYHANTDELILEDSPQGLLATTLFIESQPLLRYQLDDRVAFHAEAHDAAHECHIRLPTLTVLDARRDDWLIDGAGRKVSPLSFQFERIAGLRAWRIHQLRTGELRLYVDAEQAADTQQQLTEHLQAIVPGRQVELTRGIWQLRNAGKFKRVVSDFTR